MSGPAQRPQRTVLDDVPTPTEQMIGRRVQEPTPCPPRARQEGLPRRLTVIHGATGSALDLCSRMSSGRGHLLCKQGVRGSSPLSSTCENVRQRSWSRPLRAISVPLALAAGIVASLSHPLIEHVSDLLIGLSRRVLVDHRRPHAVVAHPRFQVRQAHPVLRRQFVPGVPQIMKMQSRLPRSRPRQQTSRKPCGSCRV